MELAPGKLAGDQFVILKQCPFKEFTAEISEWSPEAKKLVANYNRHLTKGGGSALHPLCIVHHGVREDMPDPVVNIACRSTGTDTIAISEANMRLVGLEHQEAVEMIAGRACLYCIRANASNPSIQSNQEA